MTKYAPSSQGLLQPLARWLDDSMVSEILINAPQEIYFERDGVMHRAEVPEYTSQTLDMLCQLIANENQQELSVQRPLLSGSLLDGSRVQIVLPPTARHYTLSIRRQVVRNFSLHDYAAADFYAAAKPFDVNSNQLNNLPEPEKALLLLYEQHAWDAFIQKAIELRKNIVISGGTSSGKTTFLNACLHNIPHSHRIITIEDTREIDIPHPNQVNLLASKGEQGLAKLSTQDLLQCCLRLRPDRIIMGEIRGAEILDFVGACATGHEGSITSIHASDPRIAFMRMTQMYKLNNVPAMMDEDIMCELQEVVDVIVQLSKSSSGRCVQSIYYKHGHLINGSKSHERSID